jgi:hypothetical protein
MTTTKKYEGMEWVTDVLSHLRNICNAKAHQRQDKAELAAAKLLALLDCEAIINPQRRDLIEAAEVEKED